MRESRMSLYTVPLTAALAALTLLPLPDQLLDRDRQSRLEVDQLPQFGITTIRTMPSW